MTKRSAQLLVNVRSRRGSDLFDEARQKLVEAGFDLTLCLASREVKELVEAAGASSSGDLVIVGGGDGTQSAIAGCLAGREAIQAVLPLGTGNAFARDLRIPAELDGAIEVIVYGEPRHVDLGLVNGRHFVNVTTVGLTTQVAQTLTDPLKRKWGRFVYAIALARAFRHLKSFHVTLKSDGGTIEKKAVQLVIGNGRYHAGPFPISPQASITSGRLGIYVVESSTRSDMVKYAMLLPLGLQGSLRTVHCLSATTGSVVTRPVRKVVVDGELRELTPFDFAAASSALRVMTPKSFPGSR